MTTITTPKVLGFFTVIALALGGAASARAQTPGELQNHIHDSIQTGLGSCQLLVVSGNDQRLPYTVISRHVNEVVVKVLPNGNIVPGVLINRDLRFGQGVVLEYLQLNGGIIFSSSRTQNGGFDDLAVMTPQLGQIAWTNSYFRGTYGMVTDYYIRQNNRNYVVNETDFVRFLDSNVIESFVSYVCSEAAHANW